MKKTTDSPFNPQILNALHHLEGEETKVCIWNEVFYFTSGEKQFIRATPRLDKFGSFYNWDTVQYDREIDQEDPAKILLLYENTLKVPSALILLC